MRKVNVCEAFFFVPQHTRLAVKTAPDKGCGNRDSQVRQRKLFSRRSQLRSLIIPVVDGRRGTRKTQIVLSSATRQGVGGSNPLSPTTLSLAHSTPYAAFARLTPLPRI